MSAEEKKRPRKASLQPTASPPPKKQKPTIPITRGKFKNRFLRKHSSLLHNCKSEGLERPRGLIITCPVGSETRALGQIRTFLDRYLPILFPEHKTVWTSRPHELDIDLKIVGASDSELGGAPQDTGGDGDDSADEMNETREESADSKNDRKFQAVDAACGGVLFIRFRVDTDPVDFVVKLFEYMNTLSLSEQNSLKKSISHCSRILPITHTMPSTLPDIQSHLEPVIPRMLTPHLDTLTTQPPTLACITEVRNREGLKKESVRDAVLKCVPGLGSVQTSDSSPQVDAKLVCWSVNLKEPTVVLFTTVFKSVCGFSVLPRYYEYKKYNVQMIGVP